MRNWTKVGWGAAPERAAQASDSPGDSHPSLCLGELEDVNTSCYKFREWRQQDRQLLTVLQVICYTRSLIPGKLGRKSTYIPLRAAWRDESLSLTFPLIFKKYLLLFMYMHVCMPHKCLQSPEENLVRSPGTELQSVVTWVLGIELNSSG